MRLTKCVVRLDNVLLVLQGILALSAAQSVSTLPDGCYLTSSIVYGNTTASSTVTTSGGPSTISTSSGASISGSSSVASSFSSSSASFNPSSTTSPTVPTTTIPSPTSNPFVITVSGIGDKLRARALDYVTFNGGNAYLSPDEDAATIFVLTVNGHLKPGNGDVGTTGNTGTLPLVQFFDSTQPSDYRWSLNGTRLMFGDTTFSATPNARLDHKHCYCQYHYKHKRATNERDYATDCLYDQYSQLVARQHGVKPVLWHHYDDADDDGNNCRFVTIHTIDIHQHEYLLVIANAISLCDSSDSVFGTTYKLATDLILSSIVSLSHEE
ncbi:hypothetical protein AYO20_00159 [Fonsecaea nubica]|uniref:DUF7908 domain-containing protein n=1 Tax=Fonsecaea nubica TaxID=856822 RepID=A0A178DGT4_9EURO|nr:hypothetical protein AYO20_00159 [Fonsecaea nubica]OAL40423.1 hypothetical protein AYO20_00159 [Fonsecaea nubica]